MKVILHHLRQYIWIYLFVVFIVGGNGWLAYTNFFAPRPVVNIIINGPPLIAAPPDGTVASVLNGDYIPQGNTAIRPMAVMIDNTVEARPSAGLSEAAIVWEALAEGGVTRLMPIWQTNNDTAIGPVRSARDYFLAWAEDVGAMYVHSGGSRDGLSALKAHPEIPDADEFPNGSSFYRSPEAAPHNLFTSTARLQTLAHSKKWKQALPIDAWLVRDVAPSEASAKIVTIDFSITPYKVIWTWDDSAKVYQRVQGGAIARDRNTGAQLTTKNIIVLAAQVDPAPDYALPGAPKIAVKIKTVGSGEAWFFRDGVTVKGKWEKDSYSSRIAFTADDGTPYAIARGQTWIEVIPKDKKDSLKFN